MSIDFTKYKKQNLVRIAEKQFRSITNLNKIISKQEIDNGNLFSKGEKDLRLWKLKYWISGVAGVLLGLIIMGVFK